MVCRENKGRSAAISVMKHMMRSLGITSYRDWEAQSLTHEMGHRFAAAPDPSREELIAMWKGMRQQVLNDPTISDADKFRPATGRGGQTGIITRIDQELERIATGCDEDGNPLKPEQLNLGKHFAAVARMSGSYMRQQEAKKAYYEVYARHMGVTADEAKSRFEALTERARKLRDNTQIDLQDGWRDGLAVAGFSSQQQADIGQSNPTRFALMTMEAERRANIASLPSRPTIRPEHVHPVLSPDDPRVAEQCVGGCGQFGHTAANCPNQAEVTAANEAAVRYAAAREKVDGMRRVAQARTDLGVLASGQPVSNVDSSGNRIVPDIDADQINPSDTAAIAKLDEIAQGENSVRKARAAAAELKEARQANEDAQQALEAARGVIPQVSSFVQEVAYNPEASVFTVTTRPKKLVRRGRDGAPAGTIREGETYVYHMTQEEYAQLVASPDFGHQISTGVFVRGPQGDRFKFENTADAAEASLQRRCPSCGQWATMNSSHRCPIDGTGTSEENNRHRTALYAEREKARLAGLGVTTLDTAARDRVTARAKFRLPGKVYQKVTDAEGNEVMVPVQGSIVLPHPRAVTKTREAGGVALGSFTTSYLDAQVSGEVAVWNEPGTGTPLYRVSKLKCSCGVRQPCRHAPVAAGFVGKPYGAVRTTGSPGTVNFERPRDTAEDQVPTMDRLNYSRIRERRVQAAVAYTQEYVTTPARRGFATGPRNAATGQPVSPHSIPSTWQAGNRRVDVDDPVKVADAVRVGMAARTDDPRAWRVSVDGAGGVWVRAAVPSPNADHQLRTAFGLPSGAGRRGVYISPERAARHHMLDRLAGREPQFLPSRIIAAPGDPDPME